MCDLHLTPQGWVQQSTGGSEAPPHYRVLTVRRRTVTRGPAKEVTWTEVWRSHLVAREYVEELLARFPRPA
jgi:hypothetical protein